MADFDLSESGVTINSDSEQYSAQDELSPPSPASESSPPLILYQPPSIWGLIRGAAINVLLPFVNGLMLGFGELFAHEAAFRLGWGGTKVCVSDFFTDQGDCILQVVEGGPQWHSMLTFGIGVPNWKERT